MKELIKVTELKGAVASYMETSRELVRMMSL